MQHNRIPVRRQSERYRVLARLLQQRAYETYAANIAYAANFAATCERLGPQGVARTADYWARKGIVLATSEVRMQAATA